MPRAGAEEPRRDNREEQAMLESLKSRRVIVTTGALTLFAALAILAGTMLTSRETVAAVSSNCTYYNNAAHTTVVGQFGKDCCNNTVAWGKKTQFSVCGGCFVCTPPPR